MQTVQYAQRGFAMFELILAIALAGLIAGWAGTALMSKVDDTVAQSTGVWMLTVHQAVNQMLRRQSDDMTGMTANLHVASHYADPYRPTVSELIAAGHLPGSFALAPPLPYQLKIHVSAPQGDCHHKGCRIEALVYALPHAAELARARDTNRLGQVLSVMQGKGASVHPFRSDRIKGVNIDMPNPPAFLPAALPVGTIAALSFYDSTQLSHLVRRDDLRDTRLQGALESAGRVTAGEFLHLQGIAQSQQACAHAGLIARSVKGDLLTCQAGQWHSPGGGFGGVFSWHSIHGCGTTPFGTPMSNPLTGACSCPSGFNAIQISNWKNESTDLEDFRTYICMR